MENRTGCNHSSATQIQDNLNECSLNLLYFYSQKNQKYFLKPVFEK